jgi:hypothetical protein
MLTIEEMRAESIARQEAEDRFYNEVNASIRAADAGGVGLDRIAATLRSLAYCISVEWKRECEGRNQGRIAEMIALAGKQEAGDSYASYGS